MELASSASEACHVFNTYVSDPALRIIMAALAIAQADENGVRVRPI